MGNAPSNHAGTKLRVWAYHQGILLKELAARIGIGANNLSRFIHGHTRPNGDHRVIIEQITDGEIPAEAWSEPANRQDKSAA